MALLSGSSLISLLTLLVSVSLASRTTFQLQKSNAAHIPGWPGIEYRATHFEPLCGKLELDRYNLPQKVGDLCDKALDIYQYQTKDDVAIYNMTGHQMKPGSVGTGEDTCLCFALGFTNWKGSGGGLCLWSNGKAAGKLDDQGRAIGSYRPEIKRSLKHCNDRKMEKLSKHWSLTVISTSHNIRPTTSGTQRAFKTAWATDSAVSGVGWGHRHDHSNNHHDRNVALGVGLGLGLPLLAGFIFALWFFRRQRQRRHTQRPELIESAMQSTPAPPREPPVLYQEPPSPVSPLEGPSRDSLDVIEAKKMAHESHDEITAPPRYSFDHVADGMPPDTKKAPPATKG